MLNLPLVIYYGCLAALILMPWYSPVRAAQSARAEAKGTV